MTDYIEFKPDEMTSIAKATLGSQAEWDRIWEGVKRQLTSLIGADLDRVTGSSLEERSQEYHQKTAQYTTQLQTQAINTTSNVAVDFGANMGRVMKG